MEISGRTTVSKNIWYVRETVRHHKEMLSGRLLDAIEGSSVPKYQLLLLFCRSKKTKYASRTTMHPRNREFSYHHFRNRRIRAQLLKSFMHIWGWSSKHKLDNPREPQTTIPRIKFRLWPSSSQESLVNRINHQRVEQFYAKSLLNYKCDFSVKFRGKILFALAGKSDTTESRSE